MKLAHVVSAEVDAETAQIARRTIVRVAETDAAQWCVAPSGLGISLVTSGLDVEFSEAPFGSRFDFRTKRTLDAMANKFMPDAIIVWDPDAADRLSDISLPKLGWVPPILPPGVYNRFTGILAGNSLRAATAEKGGWAPDKIHTVPPPTDTAPDMAAVSRKLMFTPPQSPVVVCFSALKQGQGLEVLFQALERLPDVYAWIIGTGPDQKALDAFALEHGVRPRIRFIGNEDHPAQYCKAANLVFCCHTADDLGLGVLEAWSVGAPVLAVDVLGPGMLINHKRNGGLVPAGDAQSIAEAIKWILGDQATAKKLIEGGLASFEKAGGATGVVAALSDAVDAVAPAPVAAPN